MIKNLPKRRFKGFNDEWEEKKLGEIGETYTGLTGKTKKDFGHGNAEFITYLNIFNNPISKKGLTEPIEKDIKQTEVKYGDVFFTTSSETPEEVGMSSVWLEDKRHLYLNSFCFGYRIKIKINFIYLAYLLRSDLVRKNFILLAQGISRFNISKNKAMEIKIILPSLPEQQKIGNFFQKLDKQISLYDQKINKLKALKKSYLNKMFPKENTLYPELRFKGFNDEWEEKKLEEILHYEQPNLYTVNSEKYNDSFPTPVLTAGKSFILGYTNESTGIKQASHNNPVIIFDDFTTSLKYVDFPFKVKSSAMKILYLINKKEDTYFVYESMKKLNYIAENHGRHWISIFSKFNIKCPMELEQQKIGDFFQKLDKQISLYDQKINKLKDLKKAYLNEMFVNK